MTSPKHCAACGEQAYCTDTRQNETYVRRRYECGCGRRWSTKEYVAPGLVEDLKQQIRRLDERLVEQRRFQGQLQEVFAKVAAGK